MSLRFKRSVVTNEKRNLLLFMTILCLTLTIGRIAYCLCYNLKLVRNFDKIDGAYNYSEEVEQETVDLNKISDFFTDNVTLIGYPKFQNIIVAPVDILYYENIHDEYPAYVVKKGETINFELFPKTKSELEFRGNDSIPTNEKGWRLAKPFKANGIEKDSLLYVKTEDLIRVNEEWLRKNPAFTNLASKEVWSMGLLPTKRNISKFMLLFVDRELYSDGIFLSKDMYRPIIDITVLISFFVTTILFALNILWKKKIKL